MWEKMLLNTRRGNFEVFIKGSGQPLCITHLYSEFNELGYYFADEFTDDFKVYLINLRNAGNSSIALRDEELSMKESCKDLEAIRMALKLEKWCFAGHSTGGMLGLYYSILFQDSIIKLMVGGASASNKYMEQEGSMYSPKSSLNSKLKEIFTVLKSTTSSIEERRNANIEWTNLSLYKSEKRSEYFKKPSSGKVVQSRLDYYSFKELPKYDLTNKLSIIKIPSIVYCGRYDAQCPLFFSEEINERLSNSQLYIFENSNHVPYIEEVDKFHEMVLDFKSLDK
ncbi:alpha/beta fold hydrolase [Gottfriedia acidiceleris]|uniref:alpha/beta fold hydrolase n=1 Tax=Gottfriedia acidiceleris TaxID=371036 RepID=UPI000B43A867|nr:alpha/beta fold hydrolase [Gottfriedia acidiceleris]